MTHSALDVPTPPRRPSSRSLASKIPDAASAAADRLFRAGSWAEAGVAYHRLTQRYPHNLTLWKRRLDCSRHLGHSLVVDLLLEEALADHPDWETDLLGPAELMASTAPDEILRTTRRRSCEMIESGLFFSTNKLRVCCTTHHRSLGAPVVTEFLGGAFPLDAVLAKRNEIRRANAEGVFPECAGCPHLREDDWPDKPEYLLDTLIVGPSAVCDLKCGYCFTVLEPNTVESSRYELYPILEEIIRKGYLSPDALILWAGGEPTIFKRFDDMFRLLTSHGRVKHRIYTNATRTSPAVIEALKADRATVICSMDAGTRETYAQVKGRDAFDRVVATCTRYAETGGDFRLKYLGLPGNSTPQDMEGFLALARKWKVRTIYCDTDYAALSKPPPEVVATLRGIVAGALRAGIQAEFEVASRTVPEEQLPQRVMQTAYEHLDATWTPEQRRWALVPGSNDRELTFAKMVTGEPGVDGLLLHSSGDDPYLYLPEIAFQPGERAVIAVEITAAQADLLEIYYLDDEATGYNVKNTVKVGLQPGRQRLYLPAFPFNGSLKGRIRLDPGCFQGTYVLHQLEVFSASATPA